MATKENGNVLDEVLMEYENQSRDLEKKEHEIHLLYRRHSREMNNLKKEYQGEIKSLRQDVELSSHYSQELESNFKEMLEENRNLRSKVEYYKKNNEKHEEDKIKMKEENEEIRQYFLNSVSRLTELEETIKKNEMKKNSYIVELEDTLRSERLKTMGYIEQISQLLTVIQDINLFREKKEEFKRLQVTDMLGEIFQKREDMEELLMNAKKIVIAHKRPTYRKRRILEMSALNKVLQKFQTFFKQVEMYNEVMNLRLKLRESYSKNHDLAMLLKRMESQLIRSNIEASEKNYQRVLQSNNRVEIPKDPVLENISKSVNMMKTD